MKLTLELQSEIVRDLVTQKYACTEKLDKAFNLGILRDSKKLNEDDLKVDKILDRYPPYSPSMEMEDINHEQEMKDELEGAKRMDVIKNGCDYSTSEGFLCCSKRFCTFRQ